MEHDLNILMIFGIEKNNNFDPNYVFVAIDTYNNKKRYPEVISTFCKFAPDQKGLFD